eukprot:gene14578-14702_t
MFGLSRSIEHEIYWLKYAASKGEEAAQKFLNLSGDSPNFVFVGGGISGAMAAILFAKAREDGKELAPVSGVLIQ